MLNTRTIQFIYLNFVRALSIISLVLVFSSTIMVMVTNVKAVNVFEAHKAHSTMIGCNYIVGSTIANQPAGVFWAINASLSIIFQTIILFLSEISCSMAFFDRFFPVLGSSFGLGVLGLFQCLISIQILSHLVDDFTLISAFVLFAIGCLNMFLGLIFHESAKPKRSITAWRTRGESVLPTSKDKGPLFVSTTSVSPTSEKSNFSLHIKRQDSTASDQESWWGGEKAGYGFGIGRQGERAAALRELIPGKPVEPLPPRYMTPPPPTFSHSRSHTIIFSASDFYFPHREGAITSPQRNRHHHGTKETFPPVFKSSPIAL
ncbi:hypothetical protein BYT27DRAFT_6462146 [Phlegmacium glaucopus]|nr:hypothetical protein BYT27DRAFT_6462146 [Phlegmacium glaucopus]